MVISLEDLFRSQRTFRTGRNPLRLFEFCGIAFPSTYCRVLEECVNFLAGPVRNIPEYYCTVLYVPYRAKLVLSFLCTRLAQPVRYCHRVGESLLVFWAFIVIVLVCRMHGKVLMSSIQNRAKPDPSGPQIRRSDLLPDELCSFLQ